MKKKFQAAACVLMLVCAAYGALILVKKLFCGNKIKESDEFDSLYEDFIALHPEL